MAVVAISVSFQSLCLWLKINAFCNNCFWEPITIIWGSHCSQSLCLAGSVIKWVTVRIVMGGLGSPTVLSSAVLLLFLLPYSFWAFCVHKTAFVKMTHSSSWLDSTIHTVDTSTRFGYIFLLISLSGNGVFYKHTEKIPCDTCFFFFFMKWSQTSLVGWIKFALYHCPSVFNIVPIC